MYEISSMVNTCQIANEHQMMQNVLKSLPGEQF